MMTVIYVVGWIVALRLAYEFLGEQGAGMWFAVALALLTLEGIRLRRSRHGRSQAG